MSERDWDRLFDLIERAINLPDMTADEKGTRIRAEAEVRNQEANLCEFVCQVGTD